jgi:pyrroloquinoline quinone biosynthesis protein D
MTDLPESIQILWVPKVNPHFRLQWEEAQQCFVLLYPEGMIKFNGSAAEILQLCDGQRSIADIIAALENKFPDAEGIAMDVCDFFTDAFLKRWLIHD